MSTDLIVNQALINAIVVGALQHLKNAKWFPWLTKETAALNRMVAVLVSGATALGVHTTFDHTTGVLTVTGLTLATIGSGLYDWLLSFVTQQVIYKATVSEPTQVVAKTPVTK